MEQMVYQNTRLKLAKVLDSGDISGYKYIILSFGTHPCGYVSIPKNHRLYKKKYKKLPHNGKIRVHGGITYADKKLLFGKNDIGLIWIKGHWIGWDYAHWGDRIGTPFIPCFLDKINNKEWTTEEILEDVKSVVKQLQAAE